MFQHPEYLSIGSASEEQWIKYYLILAWSAELGNGVIQTITGERNGAVAESFRTTRLVTELTDNLSISI